MAFDALRWGALIAGLHGAAAVAMGAFAAHALSARLSERALALVETGARYQLVHAAALLGAALLARALPGDGAARLAVVAFAAGALIFAGTLYGMAFGGPRWLGAITPIGGTLLIAGWILVAVAGWRAAST